MNDGAGSAPIVCDVLVVGAGPAGSAAAIVLARRGKTVVLADSHAFPRDKICGDGLICDAHNALAQLGVLGQVLAQAQPVAHVGCIGPRGGRIDVPGTLAVLPRRDLDLITCTAAAAAGATMIAPARFVSPLVSPASDGVAERVVGALLEDGSGVQREVHASQVLLATGASPQALIAAGMCERRTPSGIAMRGYVHNPAMVGRIRDLDVVWHPKLAPGYGWIFPCPGGVFNIGVGVAHSHAKGRDGRHTMRDLNLRAAFDAFQRVYAPAGDLIRGGTWVGELKGAPLRCSLDGARWTRPGLLVTGEAAGTTYAFTGEGIGKALETGIAAAEAVLAHTDDDALRRDYEARLERLRPRYAVYEKANTVNSHPWLVDLLVWSARRSPGRLKRMSGVLRRRTCRATWSAGAAGCGSPTPARGMEPPRRCAPARRLASRQALRREDPEQSGSSRPPSPTRPGGQCLRAAGRH